MQMFEHISKLLHSNDFPLFFHEFEDFIWKTEI